MKAAQAASHTFWDGLLGKAVSVSSIERDVKGIKKMLEDDSSVTKHDIASHLTFESWAKESFELAKKDGRPRSGEQQG
jgi:hypothetical protein